jgi:hypothetical protein
MGTTAGGFNLYHSETETGHWILLNSDLILSKAPPGSPGSNYSFADELVKPRGKYYYRVEAIDTSLTPMITAFCVTRNSQFTSPLSSKQIIKASWEHGRIDTLT